MKKKMQMVAAGICYLLGIAASLYVGGWLMIACPIRVLYRAYLAQAITIRLLVGCIVKILLSTTMSGLVWCMGYIGYNYFKGTEDPEWETETEEIEEKKDKRE
jgi:hypothetical protein